jgi:RNA recognition motif-containing protein
LTFNQHQIDGRRLRVERAKVNRTLFLAKFSLSLTAPELRKTAEAYGTVESVTIIKHHPSNKSKGCGFVKYQYREDAADAFAGLKLKYKKWVVEWATSANDPEVLGVAKNLVYIGGLPSNSVTESIITNYFSQYGHIEDISLVHPSLSRPAALERSTGDSAMAPNSASSTYSSDTTLASPHSITSEQSDTRATSSIPSPTQTSANSSPLTTTTLDASLPSSATQSKSPTSYAFVTFADDAAASAAIENENGAVFLGEIIRVQYCETPEMKLRKKMAKLRDQGFPTHIGDPGFVPPLFTSQAPPLSFGFFPSPPHTSTLPGPSVPYWMGQAPLSPTSSSVVDPAGWYFMQTVPLPIPTEIPDQLSDSSSPRSLQYAIPTFHSPHSFHPLGYISPGQLSPLASQIPTQPFFPISRAPEPPGTAPTQNYDASKSSHSN